MNPLTTSSLLASHASLLESIPLRCHADPHDITAAIACFEFDGHAYVTGITLDLNDDKMKTSA